MASLLAIGGTALVNAVMFSGTSAAFSMLRDHGRAEAKRHNLAIEKVAKEREKWSEERQQRLDYLNKRIAERKHAARTFANLEVAEEEYYRVTGHRLSPLRDEPKLSDFYNPSRQRCGNCACHSWNEYRWIVGLYDEEINEERGT